MTFQCSVKPAPYTWANLAQIGLIGHKAYFEQHGFTVIKGLLEAEQVATAQAEIDRIIEQHATLIPNVRVIGRRNPLLPSFDLEDDAVAEGQPVMRKVTGLRALSTTLAYLLVENPTLLSILHELLGTRVELYRDALMMKNAYMSGFV